jgi:uncharacterized phiE125 gp8 family phage protein
MKLTQRVAPAGLPITTQEILDHLRIADANPPDLADILRIAAGCVAELDGPTGKLRRALMPQSWSLWLDSFCDRTALPLPPLISVDSILYLGSDFAWQTLAEEHYRVIDGGYDRSEIVLAPPQSWPATAQTPACIEIRFTAGYVDGSPPEPSVPRDIVNAALEMVALRYSVRDGLMFNTDRMVDELPAMQALQRYRVYC